MRRCASKMYIYAEGKTTSSVYFFLSIRSERHFKYFIDLHLAFCALAFYFPHSRQCNCRWMCCYRLLFAHIVSDAFPQFSPKLIFIYSSHQFRLKCGFKIVAWNTSDKHCRRPTKKTIIKGTTIVNRAVSATAFYSKFPIFVYIYI